MRGLGTLLALLGVLYGWVAAAVVWRRTAQRGPRRPVPPLGLAGSALLLGSLLLPYADGHSRSTGRPITLAGWDALDVLSLLTIGLISVTTAAAGRLVDDGRPLVTPVALQVVLGLSAAAVLAGKWLVYAGYEHFGPAPLGFGVAAAGAAILVVAGIRGRGPAA